MRTVNAPEFSRNYGFWNESVQREITDSTSVAMAGAGGDGFQLTLRLAAMGVQRFDIADPEVFEPENANRVPGARTSTYGRKKVDVLKEQILDINPDADVRIYPEGINADNVEAFLSRATMSFDETELTHMELGTMLAREARKRGIPNVMVMNVGFAGQVTSFHPNSKYTFERFMGIPEGMPLDEIAERTVDLSRCVPYLPKYVDMETFKAVMEGAPLPSVAQGVDVAAALGSSQALKHIASRVDRGWPKPTWAPRVQYADALIPTASGETRFPRLSHYRHLGVVVARNMLHAGPKASYTAGERERRQHSHELEQRLQAAIGSASVAPASQE